jgi:hypothetical protein
MVAKSLVCFSQESLRRSGETFEPARQPAYASLSQSGGVEACCRPVIPRLLPQLPFGEQRPDIARRDCQLPVQRAFGCYRIAKSQFDLGQRRPWHALRRHKQ